MDAGVPENVLPLRARALWTEAEDALVELGGELQQAAEEVDSRLGGLALTRVLEQRRTKACRSHRREALSGGVGRDGAEHDPRNLGAVFKLRSVFPGSDGARVTRYVEEEALVCGADSVSTVSSNRRHGPALISSPSFRPSSPVDIPEVDVRSANPIERRPVKVVSGGCDKRVFTGNSGIQMEWSRGSGELERVRNVHRQRLAGLLSACVGAMPFESRGGSR